MKLALRLIVTAGVVTALVGAFQILVILSFVKFTLDPSPWEINTIIQDGIPIIIFLLAVFFLAVIAAAWPLARFLVQANRGQKSSDSALLKIQARIVNLGYQIAFISLGFYFGFYPAAASLWCYFKLGWGMDKLIYASAAGIIAGIINLPICLYATNLITLPLMAETFRHSATVPAASRSGYPINIRIKLILAFGSLALSTLMYATIVGYSQARQTMNQAQVMENELAQFDQCRKCHDFKTMASQKGHLENPEALSRLQGRDTTQFARLNQRVGNLWLFYTAIVALALALALVLSFLAAKDINRPIEDLVRHAR